MIEGVQDPLRLRLNGLEARGQGVLDRRTRDAAVRCAAAWAAPASALGGGLFLLSALVGYTSVTLAVLMLVTPPLIAGGWGYALTRHRGAAGRSVALALLDHHFDLKDRLQTADEFVRADPRSPFQDAALQEAAPWLEKAAHATVEDATPLKIQRSRLWLWPALGLVLAALAFAVPRGASSVADVAPEPSARVGRPAPDARAAPVERPAIPPMGTGAGAANAKATENAPSAAGGARDVLAGLRAWAAELLNPDRGSSGGRRDQAGPAGSIGEAAASGGEASGQGAGGGAGRGVSRSSAGEKSDDPSQTGDATTSGEAGAGDDSDVAATRSQRGGFAGGRQDAPSARQPEPPQSRSDTSQGGEGQRPSRGRRSEQSNSSRDQGGGQGESGQQSGPDAGSKKGRGVSSLLLATPMEDRLAGMASPGRVSTTSRDGVPQAFPVTPGQAGDRGMARGQAGRTGSRTLSAQDQRLTRDYFTARNGGGR